MNITELLDFSLKTKASDLHLSAGLPPMFRIDGDIRRVDLPVLSHQEVMNLLHSIMNEEQKKQYAQQLDIDFSFEISDMARFRVNVFQQTRGAGAVLRTIPLDVLSLDELHAPFLFKTFCKKPNGLILVTGPTGSGKSTTLAAMLDYINRHQEVHIITIEDPIEFIHRSYRALVNQREVYRDTHGFHQALRAALREDPDIILVGELRDLETIRLALTAAETGHLVLATLHTSSAAKTIDRIVDVFPAAEKDMIRTLLSESLQAVICQMLVKKIGGGRVAAHEIMIGTPAIRNLIRETKLAQMYSCIQTSRREGMQTMDQSLGELLQRGIINADLATDKSVHKEHTL